MTEFLTFFSECGLLDPDGITTEDLKEALKDVALTAGGFVLMAILLCLLLANI